jgi:hypothetical protein
MFLLGNSVAVTVRKLMLLAAIKGFTSSVLYKLEAEGERMSLGNEGRE